MAFWAASGIALLGLLVPAGGQAPNRSVGVRGSTTPEELLRILALDW